MPQANLPPEIPRSRHNEMILVVEDEPAVSRLAEIVLTSLGYRVVTAKDGEEGLQKFQQHQDDIALVFTDVLMPAMNGPCLVDRIRSLSPGVRVLYASGYTKSSLGGAFDGYPREEDEPLLVKPYTAEQLGETLGQILQSA